MARAALLQKLSDNRLYHKIDDPFGHSRVCYKSRTGHFDRMDLHLMLDEHMFLFIANNGIVFFKQEFIN